MVTKNKKEKDKIKELESKLINKKKEVNTHKNFTKILLESFQNETKKQVLTAIMAAFGFLIALSWRDVIIFYTNKLLSTISFSFLKNFEILTSAVLTTIFCVIGIIIFTKWGKVNVGKNILN